MIKIKVGKNVSEVQKKGKTNVLNLDLGKKKTFFFKKSVQAP